MDKTDKKVLAIVDDRAGLAYGSGSNRKFYSMGKEVEMLQSEFEAFNAQGIAMKLKSPTKDKHDAVGENN